MAGSVQEVTATGTALAAASPAYGGRLRLVETFSGAEPRALWTLASGARWTAAATSGPAASAVTRVQVVPLELAYDAAADPLAQPNGSGSRSWADADCILDVGYALGNRDNLERLVLPLEAKLRQLGVPRVALGGTRKVTEELKLLPADRQIGQTGVAVNPPVLLAFGVSGAPQHLDYIGERTTILAFNRDPEAPIMTLNHRKPLPHVHPVPGDLFDTIPRLLAALSQDRSD
jgi:electron transfer flavoprotein alpha subunit